MELKAVELNLSMLFYYYRTKIPGSLIRKVFEVQFLNSAKNIIDSFIHDFKSLI